MDTNTNRGLLPGQALDQASPLLAMNGQHRRAVKQAQRRTNKADLSRYIGTIDWSDFDE
jgi:hypothetical protein